MRNIPKRLTLALVAAGVWIGVPASSAQAQIAWKPCADGNEIACGHVTVALDPSGAVPGTITLALQRHRSSVGDARSAIIALAGGPGQPALPFTESFDELLGPIAATRDLIVFDQRGIGLSHPLSCHAFENPRLSHSVGQLIATCASQLGPTRSLYTTADTVADIEAIRQAGEYDKLVLYGTSYGTKVAEEYAQAHPSHVEALVLDSVVPPNGPDALNRPTFAAVPRVLSQLCAAHACARITSNPTADLRRVIARMAGGTLRGRVIDGFGKAHEETVDANELLDILLEGDFSSVLRAELLTSIAAAARGDAAPLERLVALVSSGGGEPEDFDSPLYYATTCEEVSFPWNRAASAKTRLAQARKLAAALPAQTFAPFTANDALHAGDIQECAHWPSSLPAPPLDETPFPNVPALILSGADDLRTPTANAREVAAQIPDAHLLVVPHTGHAVLTGEPGDCATKALRAMFSAKPVKPCRATPAPASPRPPPLPPRHLGQLSAAPGSHGLPGRTLHAVALTLADTTRQLFLRLKDVSLTEAFTLPTLRAGGLRAGWAEYANNGFALHGVSYVPGVTVSGIIRSERVDLRIGGSADAHGTLRLGAHHALVGRLGGSHVVLPADSRASAAIVDGNAQASSDAAGGRAAAVARIRELTRLLPWVQP
ncbi:MAG TPA: alpha/beta fold hydrolase [Solirubrobacteraceae bacterium]|nr:alpha/beta fold hydrolase [Solirubrobacteraceae bacterium]